LRTECPFAVITNRMRATLGAHEDSATWNMGWKIIAAVVVFILSLWK